MSNQSTQTAFINPPPSRPSDSSQARVEANPEIEPVEKGKQKQGGGKSSSQQDDEQQELETPTFFCRRPPTVPRSSEEPVSMGFLHRIVRENQARSGLVATSTFAAPSALDNRSNKGLPAANIILSSKQPFGTSPTQMGSALERLSTSGGEDWRNPIEMSSFPSASTNVSDSPLISSNALGSRTSTSLAGDSTVESTPRADTISSFSSSSSTSSLLVDPTATTTNSNRNDGGDRDKEQEQEELPWFTQLASLPELRSAGIPLLKEDQRTKTRPIISIPSASNSSPSIQRFGFPHNHFASTPQPSWSNVVPPPSTSSLPSALEANSSVTGPGSDSKPSQQAHTTASGGIPTASGSRQASYHPTPDPFSPFTPPSVTASKTFDQTTTQSQQTKAGAKGHHHPPTTSNGSNPATTTTTTSKNGSVSLASSTSKIATLPGPEIFDEELLPPDNFSMVNTWVYRSSFPKKKHFPFLRTLGLKSVL
ncbi:hypothetical protein IE53DRAFT_382773 [Violaceomyces palustris]|uniref:Uncharacterized protein n=1 Tax=Violaceomyces palustris TaxID=1673888 RepID=A0ACD0NLB5_9BASI|nr:hypothetical protein IE53DRAFT_382773 [Violaceomyces palustris]